jgi:hypothetical protein
MEEYEFEASCQVAASHRMKRQSAKTRRLLFWSLLSRVFQKPQGGHPLLVQRGECANRRNAFQILPAFRVKFPSDF